MAERSWTIDVARAGLLLATTGKPVTTADLCAFIGEGCQSRTARLCIKRLRAAGWPVASAPEGRTMTYRLSVDGGAVPAVTMPQPAAPEPLPKRKGPPRGALAQQVAELARAGLKLREIVARTGATYNAVSSAMAKLRRNGDLPRRTFASEQIDALIMQGLSSTEIIGRLGVAPRRVYARFQELKVTRPDIDFARLDRKRLRPGSKSERTRDLYLGGASYEEIAEALDTTLATVSTTVSWLRRNGYLPKSGEVTASPTR